MSFFKGRRRRLAVLLSIFLVLAITVAACAIYLGGYYRADGDAIAAFMTNGCEWREDGNENIVFEPEDATRGFILYPGGKVDHAAYIPLMQALAEEGILCVIAKMPFHLAVLDMNAAEGIRESYPEIEEWYIGGHSLGGAMAASYVAGHTDEYAGLVLLGAYSTADLSDTSLEVLSVYGSEDRVMNREKYDECFKNLPDGATETVIDGGCHAYFGMYGAQDGDGAPSITAPEQIAKTADAILDMMTD